MEGTFNMARKPRFERKVKVQAPGDGKITEMTLANARDCVRNLGFKYVSQSDAPKELEPVVGEQVSIEDAADSPADATESEDGDPTPNDVAPETAAAETTSDTEEDAGEDKKPKSKGRGK
jgi:hypothetical protein